MPLHIQKLCVGVDSVEDLAAWIERRMADRERRGQPREYVHTTRMAPKRVAEVLDGGSLYWVIKGAIQARQAITDLRLVKDADGTGRCEIVLEPELVRTEQRPRRPFQGWRYLPGPDAPRDLRTLDGADDLPPHLVQELRELGLM